MSRCIAALVLSLWVIHGSATAELAQAEQQLSLREAILAAIANNDELRAMGHGVSAQQEEVGIATSFLLPRAFFEERIMRTNNPAMVFSSKINQGTFTAEDLAGAPKTFNEPSPLNDFQTLVGVEQPVFARRANIGVAMAREELAAKQEEFARKKEELVFRVIQTALLVHTAREHVTTAQSAVTDATEHKRLAEARFAAQLGLYSDTLRAFTAVKEAEQKLVSAQKNLNVAKRALGLLLGRSEAVDIEPQLPDIALQPMDYYTDAAQARRDLKSLELRHENTKRQVQLAEAEYLPTVGVGSTFQLNDPDYPFGSAADSWQIMAYLRWNLFDGAKREHERSKARYQVAETREQLNGLKKAVAYYVYEACQGVEEARRKSELSRAAVETALEGKRLVLKRYENALSPLVDLLDAQLSLDQARANLVAAESAHRLAIAHLSFQSGTILKDLEIE
jgi:outer membrane protein TolC